MTFDVEVAVVAPASPMQEEMDTDSSEPPSNATVDAPKSQFLAELNSYDFIAAATLPHPPNYRALSRSADPEVKKLLAAYSDCRDVMAKNEVMCARKKLKPKMTFDVEVAVVAPASPMQEEMDTDSSEPPSNATVDAPKSQFLAELNSYDFIAAATLPHPPNYRALSRSADPEVKKLLAAYSDCRDVMAKNEVMCARKKLKSSNKKLKCFQKRLEDAEVKAAARAQSRRPGRKPATVKQRQDEYDTAKKEFDESVDGLDTIESELYTLAKDACSSYIEIAKQYEESRIQREAQEKTSNASGGSSNSSNDVVPMTRGQAMELRFKEGVDFSKVPPFTTEMYATQWIRAKEAADKANNIGNPKKHGLDGIPKSISGGAYSTGYNH
ncbi:hypothetical protein GQ42DRAFT_168571 [Ramicandelaber brevisporus]|nr:hypothetical protein GQ42DRAFT_168571 [Ramicandelaber brevisporus]